MHAIMWIAFFLTVWTALAIWTVTKARVNRMQPSFRERTLRAALSGSQHTLEEAHTDR